MNETTNEEPYSEYSLEGLNTDKMMRNVYCEYCKYTIETNLRIPKCGICSSPLINLLKSIMPDELA